MTPESPRTNPLPDFDREMAITRKVLERVPGEDPEWKPHPKSFSMAHLSQLVARMPGWLPPMLREPHIDLAGSAGYSVEAPSALLAEFDRNVEAAREALGEVTEAALAEQWSLRAGDKVLMTEVREDAVRSQLHHMVHHRAQLGVYLRLRDIPVPCMYGPTADEAW
ncbi:MAG: damage-inducible protein DinB [Gemmatimonadota bacterium]